MNKQLLLLLLILAPGILKSQTYDLQFIEELNNGTNFNVKVQIKASSDFLLASSNIAFEFNTAGLSSPTLLAAYNFSGTSYDDIFITQPNTGVVYLNIHYVSITNSASATTVITEWMDVASIGFTVTNTSLTSNLIFRSASPSNTVVYDCSDANPMIFTPLTAGTWFTLDNLLHSLSAELKVFLEGPYNGAGAMTTTLNTNALIPLSSEDAYPTAAFGYSASTVVSIPANIVDWVLIELRAGTGSETKEATRAAFLKNDGTIVDVDGTSPVMFTGLPDGDYYVVVRHRNHLAIMSASIISLSSSSSTLYDFSTAQAQAFGTNPMNNLGSNVFGLIAGDANGDGFITSTDFNVFNPKFTSAANGYEYSDWNLDSFVTSTDFNYFNPNFTSAKQSFVP